MKINGINIDLGYQEIDDLPVFAGDPLSIEKAVNHAVSGLLIDGGHHKQWALEQVLESLGINLQELKSALNEEDKDDEYDCGWEEGIAP